MLLSDAVGVPDPLTPESAELLRVTLVSLFEMITVEMQQRAALVSTMLLLPFVSVASIAIV